MWKSDDWKDYELLDTSDGERLERWKNIILIRPDPQIIWHGVRSHPAWKNYSARYHRASSGGGHWEYKNVSPSLINEGWNISYKDLTFRVRPTGFKHTGIFPEQAVNWDFITQKIQAAVTSRDVSVLNLFAYTGGATLAARRAGAQVTHVDSVKPVVSWARENMEASQLDGVRWMVEDALKFARREVKRGKTYQGIVLDPPAYGRGPEGERWILEENINEMLSLCGRLLEKRHSFLVLNLYSMGMSPLLARTALRQLVGESSGEQMGEFAFADPFGKMLPLGVYCRLWRD